MIIVNNLNVKPAVDEDQSKFKFFWFFTLYVFFCCLFQKRTKIRFSPSNGAVFSTCVST